MKALKSYSFVLLFVLFGTLQSYSQADKQNNKVVRVLAIGNSFSEDAIENYLYDLAKAGNHTLIIGNLYIGGASLSLHVNNVKEDKADYSYRKIDKNGNKTTTINMKISDALLDEPWDYISFQQVSSLSGNYESYVESLPQLFEYVQRHVENQQTKYVLHQTWAYQQDSNHDGFSNYDRTQSKMYAAITQTSQKVFKLLPFDLIIPAGTAIQNARTSEIGDHFTRDGYHLNLDYGRFTAACAWYEGLFGADVTKNSFVPENVTSSQAEIAKEAAHLAVENPYSVYSIANELEAQ